MTAPWNVLRFTRSWLRPLPSAQLSPGTLRDESPFAASTWCCIPSGDPPGAAGYGLEPCGILPHPASWSLVLHSPRGTLGHTSRASVLYPFG